MIIVRLTYLALLIASVLFVSNYGGNISYICFYFVLFLPLLSYLYTLYVYEKFKIYQMIDRKTVVKGDRIGYTYIVANEDFITFQGIKVHFYSKESEIDLTKGTLEYNLVPNDKIENATKLICYYRGEYPIGVKSMEISDLFGMFSITYPIKSKLNVTVLPRILELKGLSILPQENDSKTEVMKISFGREYLDSEVRNYQRGDSKKQIHHKLSARKGELMTRIVRNMPEEEISLYLNLTRSKDDDSRIIYEDKVLEGALAISYYFLKKNIPAHVVYENKVEEHISIYNKESFDQFYRSCARMPFQAKESIFSIYHRDILQKTVSNIQVIFTDKIGKDGFEAIKDSMLMGYYVIVLLLQEKLSKEENNIMKALQQYGVTIKQIKDADKLEESL